MRLAGAQLPVVHFPRHAHDGRLHSGSLGRLCAGAQKYPNNASQRAGHDHPIDRKGRQRRHPAWLTMQLHQHVLRPRDASTRSGAAVQCSGI